MIDYRRADPDWPSIDTCPVCNGSTECKYGHKYDCWRCDGVGKITPAPNICPTCNTTGGNPDYPGIECSTCHAIGYLTDEQLESLS